MTYKELCDYIKNPVPDYYERLIECRTEILYAYKTRTQATLGKELNLAQPQVSILIKLLKALDD